MADDASSSNSPNLLVEQFKDICAVDEETATRFLTSTNWNLESAVHLYFHSNDPEAIQNDDNARSEQENIRRRNVRNTPRSETSTSAVSRAPSNYGIETWGGWLQALVLLPLRLFYYSLREIFLFIYSLCGGNALAITSPHEDLQKFLDEIGTYPNNDLISWYNGSFNEVINEAKASVRFLLVYLHNPSHQSTNDFVETVLFTPLFSSFIHDNDIIIWGTDVRTNEGYKVASSFHELTYPCLALILLRDNRMACVQRISGVHPIAQVLTALETAISENRRYLNAILNERAVRDLNNRIRREQEEEYQKALEQDRAIMNERRRLESEKQEAEQREKEEQERFRKKKERLASIRERIKNALTRDNMNEKSVRVSIRFPSGAKFEETFGVDESLETLFNTVLVNENCPDDFSLVTSYPRVSLKCAPDWYREFSSMEEDFGDIKTFREAGLENSVVVLVRDNDA